MPWIDSIHGILLSFADCCLSRAPGPGLHLAKWLRRVVAEPVEDVREREVRPRAGPALPGEAGALDRGAERRRREVEEVLARLVVVPARAEDARLVPADVRRHQVQEAARHEQPLDLAERRDRVGEVFDRVVERDHVEAARRKPQLLEEARVHDRAASARARRGVAGYFRAVGAEERARRAGAEGAAVRELVRERDARHGHRRGDGGPGPRGDAHGCTVGVIVAPGVPRSGTSSVSSSWMRSSTTLYATLQKAMRNATVAMTLP